MGPVTSRPYAASLTRVVVHTGATAVSSIDDLKGRAVAVLHASYTHYILDTRGIKVRTLYPTEADILEAVDKGEMEAAGLSDEERTALRSGDCSLIRAALHDSSADLLGFIAALLIDSGTNRV